MRIRKILIVGTGFAGAVIAEQLAKHGKIHIDMIEARDHIGGNCYTQIDSKTGVMVHKYGPHIFNTSNRAVWDYINSFANFKAYQHRVKATHKGSVYSLPINLHTINQFFNKNLNPTEAKLFLESKAEKIENPQNFEEQALALIGKELYEAFFKGYTKKQWGCDPKELPASILKRLPVRFDYNDVYYNSEFIGIPENGYTEIFEKMLDHKNIKVYLKEEYHYSKEDHSYDSVIYTGPIDKFFDYKYGELSYRTVVFVNEVFDGDFQGCSVMNYTDEDVPFTRITEYKHFTPWKSFEQTVVAKEYSLETTRGMEPFYPKRLPDDLRKLNLYQESVLNLKKFIFTGRLATYRYLDMHQVIADSLNIAKSIKNCF